jgi:hypothetical protein
VTVKEKQQTLDHLNRRLAEIRESPANLVEHLVAVERRLAALESLPEFQQYQELLRQRNEVEAKHEADRQWAARREAEARAAMTKGHVCAGKTMDGDESRWLTAEGVTVFRRPDGLDLWPAPVEPAEFAATLRQYCALRRAQKLQPMEKDFHDLKAALEGRRRPWTWPADRHGPPPEVATGEDKGVVFLRRLHEMVMAERRHIAGVEQRIPEDPEERKHREEQEALRQQVRESEWQDRDREHAALREIAATNI